MLMQPVPIHGPPRDPEPEYASGSKKNRGYNLNKIENRRFTYKELEKFTSDFKRSIGQGGFGPVYYGRLEDDTEVAVKMRSESSSHGLNEFLAEVPNLSDLKTLKAYYQFNFANNICFVPCYIGSELIKGVSQESSVSDWLLLGERSFGSGL